MENIGSERSIGSLPEPAVWIDILVEGKGSLRYVSSCVFPRHRFDPHLTLILRQQLGNCIGRGQFGSVYLGLNIKTGETVAVKRIRLEGLADVEVQQLKREVELMRGLNHPAIVKYVGACETKGHLNIVLEYVLSRRRYIST
jgi:serine/threonine protein kinase